jgi:hypothetical protein
MIQRSHLDLAYLAHLDQRYILPAYHRTAVTRGIMWYSTVLVMQVFWKDRRT